MSKEGLTPFESCKGINMSYFLKPNNIHSVNINNHSNSMNTNLSNNSENNKESYVKIVELYENSKSNYINKINKLESNIEDQNKVINRLSSSLKVFYDKYLDYTLADLYNNKLKIIKFGEQFEVTSNNYDEGKEASIRYFFDITKNHFIFDELSSKSNTTQFNDHIKQVTVTIENNILRLTELLSIKESINRITSNNKGNDQVEKMNQILYDYKLMMMLVNDIIFYISKNEFNMKAINNCEDYNTYENEFKEFNTNSYENKEERDVFLSKIEKLRNILQIKSNHNSNNINTSLSLANLKKTILKNKSNISLSINKEFPTSIKANVNFDDNELKKDDFKDLYKDFYHFDDLIKSLNLINEI